MEEQKKSGLGIAALVVGIISLIFAFIPVINFISYVLGLLALIFGIISAAKNASKGQAIAGIILGSLSLLIAYFMTILFVSILHIGNSFDWNPTSVENWINGVIDKAEDQGYGTYRHSSGESDEVDVKFLNFYANTDNGYVDSKLIVKVKNVSDETRSFKIHIKAVDDNNNRLKDDYIYASRLEAGESQNFEAFKYIDEDEIDDFREAEFEVVDVSSY